MTSKAMDAAYLVWFKGRNTCTVVNSETRSGAIAAARAKKVAGHNQPVVKARLANAEERRAISKGTWIRTRADGSKTSGTGSYKYRPQLKPG
jgi:hypothetical protein